MAPPSRRRTAWPPLLRKPFYIADAPTDAAARAEWAQRWKALFDFLGVDPGEKDAYSNLLLRLTDRVIPGFKVRATRPRSRRQKKVGKRRLIKDRPLLVASVDRLAAGGKTESQACSDLSRAKYVPGGTELNVFRGKKKTTLENLHHKHKRQQRETLAYFALFPGFFCQRGGGNACFSQAEFDDCDLAELANLCLGQGDCEFLRRVQTYLRQLKLPGVEELLRPARVRERRPGAIVRVNADKARALKELRTRALGRGKPRKK